MFFISTDSFLIFLTSIGYFIATIGIRVIRKNELVVNLKCNQTIIDEEEVDTFFGVYSVWQNDTQFIHNIIQKVFSLQLQFETYKGYGVIWIYMIQINNIRSLFVC